MPGLFDAIDIKGLRLKNRLVMAPMATNMATDEGEVTDRHIRHYTARATGADLLLGEYPGKAKLRVSPAHTADVPR